MIVKNKQNLMDLYQCIHTENKVSTNSINYSYCSYLQMSNKGCLSHPNLTGEAIHARMLVRSSMLLHNFENDGCACVPNYHMISLNTRTQGFH